MDKAFLLGADIGTSSAKLVLFDSGGRALISAKRSYPIQRPQPGYAEQDPSNYYEAVAACIREILEAVPEAADRIAAYAAAGQSSTEVMLDAEGKVLLPAIVWQDMRAAQEGKMIAEHFSDDKRERLLGFRIPPSANYTASRLLWLRRNHPELAGRVHKVMQPKDYVNFRLTGEFTSDVWCNKSLVNVRSGLPSGEILDYLGFGEGILCRQLPPHTVGGFVTPEAAAKTGLRVGTPVAAGFSDSIGTMLSTGALSKPGLAFDCTGTSEIVGLSLADEHSAAGLLTIPGSLTGSYPVIYGPTQSGGSSLLWLMDNILRRRDYDGAVAECAEIPAGAGGLVFLPYLNGERAPLWDSGARGAFTGILATHDSRHMTRAVLEGVAMSVRHCLEIGEEAAGSRPELICLIGGGSRYALWNQIRADVCGVPVLLTGGPEGCALGAAMLAGVAGGIWESVAEASGGLVPQGERYIPDPAKKEVYDNAYAVYRNEYKAQLTLRGL